MRTEEAGGPRRALGVRRVLAGVAGAKLCYGEPVPAGDRVVIPVARVKAVGGFGSGEDGDASGGGGGGVVDAAPVGFIEVTPQGARFEAIPDPAGLALAVRNAVGAATLAAAALAFRRRRGVAARSPRRLLSR